MTATKSQPVAANKGCVRDLILLAFEVLAVAAIGAAASQQFLRLREAVDSFDVTGAGHWLRQLVLERARTADPVALVLAGAVAGVIVVCLLVLVTVYLVSALAVVFVAAGPATRDRSPNPADITGRPAGDTVVLADTICDPVRS